MQLENSFSVGASPDQVFAYLLDVNRVVGCVPGAELTEIVDEATFKGKVKIKVGPITVAYSGSPGSARATAHMSVEPGDGGSVVKIVTDYSVAGRVAQFGRGVMEDVSRRLVNDMAACIKANVENESTSKGTNGGDAGSASMSSAQAPVQIQHVNALEIFFAVLWGRLTRLFGGPRQPR